MTTTVFSASGMANGPTKAQALDRARAQAQTLLDAFETGLTKCPGECPIVEIEADPDYDSRAPVYRADADAPAVFVCTIEVSRAVTIKCSTDGALSPDDPPPGPTGEEPTGDG